MGRDVVSISEYYGGSVSLPKCITITALGCATFHIRLYVYTRNVSYSSFLLPESHFNQFHIIFHCFVSCSVFLCNEKSENVTVINLFIFMLYASNTLGVTVDRRTQYNTNTFSGTPPSVLRVSIFC